MPIGRVFNKKNFYKPLYKKFINLRENAQNREKIFKFKKQKWDGFKKFYKRKLWYNKFKQHDQFKYFVSKYPNKYTKYVKRFKNSLIAASILKNFYGNLSKKYLKKIIRKTKFKNSNKFSILKILENRLDTVLYRVKFSHSMNNARQLIAHKKVLVNKKIVNSKSYNLKPGDIITINPKYKHEIINNFKKVIIWPIPNKHLFINYKTLEILIGNIKNTNISTNFMFNLNLEKILTSYYRN